jgi:hypothetical protein
LLSLTGGTPYHLQAGGVAFNQVGLNFTDYGHLVLNVTPPGSTHDSDGDGCSDTEELGVASSLGGDRDPLRRWDFYDVPAPPLTAAAPGSTSDDAVSLLDVAAVLSYFGTTAANPDDSYGNGARYGSDWNGNGLPDGQEYDRSPSAIAPKPWRSGPPDGAVSLEDAAVALLQFGHGCSDPP